MKPPTDPGCGHRPAATDGPDRLLTINEVADWIGVSVSTLYQHGYQRKGPVLFRSFACRLHPRNLAISRVA